MKGPSKHLTWKELACKDGAIYPIGWRKGKAIMLAEVFELIRKECGSRPIKVLSAYRTESWNSKIGGAKNSQHLAGRALDLSPPEGMTVGVFYSIIASLAKITIIRGIGKYRTFVHVDIRPSGRLVKWSGHGTKDSIA